MSDRERLTCPGCKMDYWWPAQAWKHDLCPKPQETGVGSSTVEPLPVEQEVVGSTPIQPAKPSTEAPKGFDRSSIMKARWAARKAQGKAGL